MNLLDWFREWNARFNDPDGRAHLRLAEAAAQRRFEDLEFERNQALHELARFSGLWSDIRDPEELAQWLGASARYRELVSACEQAEQEWRRTAAAYFGHLADPPTTVPTDHGEPSTPDPEAHAHTRRSTAPITTSTVKENAAMNPFRQIRDLFRRPEPALDPAAADRLFEAQLAVHDAEQRLRRLHEQDPYASGEYSEFPQPDWDGGAPTAEELQRWAHVLNLSADRQESEVTAAVAEQAAQDALLERVARGMTYAEAGQVLRENEAVVFRSGLPAPDSPRVEAARRVMVDGPDVAISRTQPLPVVPARLAAAGTEAALLLLRAEEAAAERALQDARTLDASGEPLWQLLDVPAARERLAEAREALNEAQTFARAGHDVNAWWLDQLRGKEAAAEQALHRAQDEHARADGEPGYHPGPYEMQELVAEQALAEAREARQMTERALTQADTRAEEGAGQQHSAASPSEYERQLGRPSTDQAAEPSADQVFEDALAEEIEAQRQMDEVVEGLTPDTAMEQAEARWRAAVQDRETAWQALERARGETAAEEPARPRHGDTPASEYESEVAVAMRMSPDTAELIVTHDQARREHQADCVGTAEQCEDCAIEENHRDRRGAAEGRLIKLDAAQRVLAQTDRAVERGELDPEHVRSANRWLRQCRQVEDDLETYLQEVYDAEPGRFEDAQAHAEYWESRLARAARSRESAERAVSRLGLDAARAEEQAAEAALEELVEHFDRPLTGEASYHEEGWAAEEKAAELRLTEAREARQTVERQLDTPPAGQVIDDALGEEVEEVLAYDWSEYRYAQGLDDLGDDSDNESALAGHDTAVVVEELQVVPRPGLPLSWLHVNEWQSELSHAELGEVKEMDAKLEAYHQRMRDHVAGREHLPDAVEAALADVPAQPAVVVEQGDAEYDDPEGDDILERLTPLELEGARLTREGVGDPDPEPESASMRFGFVAPAQRSGDEVAAAVDAARDAVNNLSDQRSRAERDQAEYERARQMNVWARPCGTGHDYRSDSSADAYGLDL